MPISKFPKPMSGRKFSGVLLEPIDRPNRLAIALIVANHSEAAQEKAYRFAQQYEHEQIVMRIDALRKYYTPFQPIQLGYNPPLPAGPKTDRDLLIALAQDFIVGFRSNSENIQTKPGRKKGTSKDKPLELVAAISEKTAKGISILRACELLSKQKNSKWLGTKPTVIKSRYDRIIAGWRNAFAESADGDDFFSALKKLPK